LVPGATFETQLTSVAAQLAQQTRLLAPYIYTPATSQNALLSDMQRLPYASATVKLHKEPSAMRFLACSGSCGLKTAAVWLTRLLRSVDHVNAELWRDFLHSSSINLIQHFEWPPRQSWSSSRIHDILRFVEDINFANITHDEFIAGGGFQGRDVERLYTNIQLPELRSSFALVCRLGMVCSARAYCHS